MHRHAVIALALVSLLAASDARAVPQIYKHDQFPADFATALAQMNGMSLATQPGFVAGEAFGQIFRPSPNAYPLSITGFDLILAAAPLSPNLTVNAQIEVYNTPSTGPDPQSQPIFVASTAAIFNPNTQDLGLPLQGGVGYSVTFDLEDPSNHPPQIFSGNIFLVIRFSDPTSDATSGAWPVLECVYYPPLLCGCQGVGTIQDPVTTAYANVMHVITPLGSCSGNKTWMWAEDAGVSGDFVMRLRADVASAPCEPACGGLACGDDGCGGSCGTCGANLECYQNQCMSCVPNCIAKQCGDNGCGGSCGICTGGDLCTAGWCEAPCTADCGGRVCGDDGCGGDCGACQADAVCNAAGKCVLPCTPTCASSDACGDDGCAGSCGTCATGSHCDAGQCAPNCVPDCAARACGDDGCGTPCGTCTGGETCVAGACVAPCAPDCGTATCGDDGCGGDCGTCGAGTSCDAGRCAAALAIDDISPDFGLAGETTAVAITGRGFAPGVTVLIGGRALAGVTVVSSQVLTGTVPADLNPGHYSVIATNPDALSATLPDAFEVKTVATSAHKSSGCATGGGQAGGALAFGLALALLFVRRRRAA